ncbi:MAG: FAD:protein FMN transferase [Bacteroidales bacterium]|nr:MAG: FAD:protein FMN transferase [Bacteroidales bacterium]
MKTKHLACLLLVSILFSCNPKKEMITYEGFTQGTTFSIKYFASVDSVFILNKGIDSIFSEINHTASTYDKNSIISKVNSNQDIELNYDFIKLFNKSIEVSDSTNGCFDITVGDLVRKWGFGFKNNKMPTEFQVDSLMKSVGYKNLSINNNRLVKKLPETKIDFNAIAQGYTVDLVAEYFLNNNCTNFIVEIGGEVRANGSKQVDNPWIVGIEKPAPTDSSTQAIQLKIELNNKSISTSGNYRKYFVKDGVKYSHTIDPKTGYPVHHSLLSVSIIADDCTTADAYATAFMVMGIDRAKEFLKDHPKIEAYFIYVDSANNNKVYYTPNFLK